LWKWLIYRLGGRPVNGKIERRIILEAHSRRRPVWQL
jgi:hypothetical protein